MQKFLFLSLLVFLGFSAMLKAEDISFEDIKRSAETGDLEAICHLGTCHLVGIEIPKNPAKAVELYREAASKGSARAMNLLGICLAQGISGSPDTREAVSQFKSAANIGNADAQANLAFNTLLTPGLENEMETIKWLWLTVRNGHASAWQHLLLKSSSFCNEEAAQSFSMAAYYSFQKFDGLKLNNHLKNMGLKTEPKGFGSGFIVAPQYMITNDHVVRGARKIYVCMKSKAYEASVFASNHEQDLALLHVRSLPQEEPIRMAPDSKIKLGQSVRVIGFPQPELQGFAPKLTFGEISGLRGFADSEFNFEINAPLHSGNSGGPVLNENGELIGVSVARLTDKSSQRVNYAVRGEYLIEMLKKLPAGTIPASSPSKGAAPEASLEKAVRSTAMIILYNEP